MRKDKSRRDVLTAKQRSYCMSQIKSVDTKIEIAVRSVLHKRGLRFRKNVKNLPGRPDIVFPSAKLVVFLDGNFWHGHNFPKLKKRLTPFWINKISKNIARDKKNHRLLVKTGWLVLRFWEEQTWKNMSQVVDKIESTARTRMLKFQ